MDACVLGAFDFHDCSTHDSLLGAFGSALHELSSHDDLFLEALGPPFHKLSTNDDWFLPDTEENKEVSRRMPYSKRDPRLPLDRTPVCVNQSIPPKNWTEHQAPKSSSIAVEGTRRRLRQGGRVTYKVWGQCRSGSPFSGGFHDRLVGKG